MVTMIIGWALIVAAVLLSIIWIRLVMIDAKKRTSSEEKEEVRALLRQAYLIDARPVECWLPDEYQVRLTFYRNITFDEYQMLERIADECGAEIEISKHYYSVVCRDIRQQERCECDSVDLIFGSYETAVSAIKNLKKFCKNGRRV